MSDILTNLLYTNIKSIITTYKKENPHAQYARIVRTLNKITCDIENDLNIKTRDKALEEMTTYLEDVVSEHIENAKQSLGTEYDNEGNPIDTDELLTALIERLQSIV